MHCRYNKYLERIHLAGASVGSVRGKEKYLNMNGFNVEPMQSQVGKAWRRKFQTHKLHGGADGMPLQSN